MSNPDLGKKLSELGRKPKILFVNEASFLRTGFSTYGWQIMKRLYETGKYEIVELGSYAKTSDPRWKDPKFGIKWKYYGAIPEDNDQAMLQEYQKGYHFNQFGKLMFETILIKEKPDIVIDIRDRWMASEWQLKSPYRKFFTYIYMPCVDSHPPQPAWVEDYKNSDYILGYSWYAKHILEREGVKCWDVTNPGVDMKVFNTNKTREECLERWGFRKTVKPILGVFRNQKRKLLPELVYSYLIMKNESPEAYKDTVLWLHTSWPDVGFNIPLVMEWASMGRVPWKDAQGRIKEKRFKIGLKPSDVVMSYICYKCGHAFVSQYVNGSAVVRDLHSGKEFMEQTSCDVLRCQSCGNKEARPVNTQVGFYPEDFADVYRAAYLHVQPAIAGADEMPTNEAKACGTPILAPVHAAMHEKVEKTNYCPDDRWKGGIPIELDAVFTEAETMQQRCFFNTRDLAAKMAKVLTDAKMRERLSQEAVEVTKKYYNWDDIAAKWDNLLWDTVQIKHKNNWEAPPALREYKVDSIPSREEMDDAAFIRWCYKNFLNVDEPDGPGFQYWMGDMSRGRSRENVIDFFKSQADEHNKLELARVGQQGNIKGNKLTDYLDKNDTFRVMVVMPGTAGDLHLLTGTLSSLYKKYNRKEPWGLYVVTEPKYASILLGLDYIKNIIPYTQQFDNSKMLEQSGLVDICYTPHIVTQRFEHYVHNGHGRHLAKIYADMCNVELGTIEIRTEDFEGLPKDYYTIHAKTSMKSKDWPVERFHALVKLFPDVQFVQIGGKDDPAINAPNVIDIRGKTSWNQMAHVVKYARGHIGLDSVPAHIASSVGTRNITLMSATYPDICGPLNTHGGKIIFPTNRPNACQRPCHMLECPSKEEPCITRISVREVAKAMEELF